MRRKVGSRRHRQLPVDPSLRAWRSIRDRIEEPVILYPVRFGESVPEFVRILLSSGEQPRPR